MARVLYVVTRAQRRGAEVDATLLAAHMVPDYEPMVATLYAGADPAILGGRVPVLASGVAPGPVRKLLGISPASIRFVRSAIRDYGPDLIVAYGGEPLLHAIPAARKAKVPVLYVKISMSVEKLKRGRRRAAFRRALSRAAAVAAVAPHLASELLEDLEEERSVHITPTFRTASDVAPARHRDAVREEFGFGPDDVVAVFAGNLSSEKGPDVALEAVAGAPSNVRLVVAGDGPLAAALAERAARPDLDGRVTLLGARTDVPRLLAGADLVLSTSRQEGRPGVILEAALAGLPVVATQVGSIGDLLRDGTDGLLVAPGDVAGLTAALATLAGDAGARSRLGLAARARSSEYLPDVVLPAWRAAFEDALSTFRARSE